LQTQGMEQSGGVNLNSIAFLRLPTYVSPKSKGASKRL
jgi:hypothetical protein